MRTATYARQSCFKNLLQFSLQCKALEPLKALYDLHQMLDKSRNCGIFIAIIRILQRYGFHIAEKSRIVMLDVILHVAS